MNAYISDYCYFISYAWLLYYIDVVAYTEIFRDFLIKPFLRTEVHAKFNLLLELRKPFCWRL